MDMNFTHEFYDLAMVLVGLDPSSSDEFQDEARVTELLLKKYRFDDPQNFEELIRNLLPLIAVGNSTLAPLQSYKGFASERTWLCKVPVDDLSGRQSASDAAQGRNSAQQAARGGDEDDDPERQGTRRHERD